MHSGLIPEMQRKSEGDERRAARRALRNTLLKLREALTPEQCESWAAAIRTHLAEAFPGLSGRRVGFCWPIRNEPDLRPLMQDWLAKGGPDFRALLPVVCGRDEPLRFRAWGPACRMEEDRYGIPSPVEGDFLRPEALLIPVNAFDGAGYRLGYGGGFFDRTLASLDPTPLAIGVGYELARVDTIFPEEHDVRLDAVITEAGVWRAG